MYIYIFRKSQESNFFPQSEPVPFTRTLIKEHIFISTPEPPFCLLLVTHPQKVTTLLTSNTTDQLFSNFICVQLCSIYSLCGFLCSALCLGELSLLEETCFFLILQLGIKPIEMCTCVPNCKTVQRSANQLQMSINSKMNKQLYIHTMQCYTCFLKNVGFFLFYFCLDLTPSNLSWLL